MKKIQIFGTAGAGKSTLAARLFSDLKILGQNVHLITEYAKELAIENKKIKDYDQLFCTAEQIKREQNCNGKFDIVVTDSPVLLGAAYARIYEAKCYDLISLICARYESESDSLSIFLKPSHKYEEKFRFESEQKAMENEKIIYSLFYDYCSNKFEFNPNDYENILKKCVDFIKPKEIKKKKRKKRKYENNNSRKQKIS